MPARTTRADALLETAEGAGSGGGWILLLIGWILARNLLEGVLEAPRTLGFEWREDLSAAMVFLHFPLFYLFLFAGIVLWLHLMVKRPLVAAARACSLGFGLLLVAPVVDAFVSGGRGYDLRYLLGFGSDVARFWDPRVSLEVVSPGQRIEILLGCAAAGAYAFAARRRAGRGRTGPALGAGLAAALGVFLIAAFAGAWPSSFAGLTAGGAPGSVLDGARPTAAGSIADRGAGSSGSDDGDAGGTEDGLAEGDVAGFAAPRDLNAAYRQVFQGPGLIAGESRRHAVVMALPLLALLPLLAWRAGPARARALGARLPATRLIWYAGLVPAGAWLGAVLYAPYLSPAASGGASQASAAPAGYGPFARALAVFHPADVAALATLTAAMLAAVLAAMCWNDLADVEGDRISEPRRPLPGGLLTPAQISAAGKALAAGALFLALCVSYVAFLIVLACLLLAAAYSIPPLRLKRLPFVATAALAGLSVLSALAGFSLFAQETAPVVFPGRVALALMVGVTLGFTAKDLKDADGDRRSGIRTVATALSPRTARLVTAGLVAAGYLVTPAILPLGGVLVAASLLGAATGVLLVLRARRPDGPLLAVFSLYAVLVLGLCALRPGVLANARTERFLAAHAEVLRLEERARERMRERASEGVAAAASPAAGATGAAIAAGPGAPAAGRAAAGWPGEPRGLQERRLLAEARLDVADGRPAERLVARRPLRWEGYEELLRVRLLREGPAAAARVAQSALRLGLRPSWHLRQSAAARLAAADDVRPRDVRTAGAAPALLREAANDLRGALRFSGPRAPLLVLASDLHLRRGDAEAAARAGAEAVRLDPKDADAWAGLGVARHAAGRFGEAVAPLLRAASLQPRDPWIRNNLGVALRDAGRARAAWGQFEEAARLSPGMFEPALNLALLAEREGRWEESRRWWREAGRRRPGAPEVEAAERRLGPERRDG